MNSASPPVDEVYLHLHGCEVELAVLVDVAVLPDVATYDEVVDAENRLTDSLFSYLFQEKLYWLYRDGG